MTTAITTQTKQTFRASLAKIVQDSAELLPRHMTPERMLKLVYAAATKTPKLFQCTPASIGMCLTTCSELGLEPGDVRGHVYLIPRENRRAGVLECTLQIGYKGYAELGRRSGEIAALDAAVVYKGEIFTVSRGAHPDIQHTWSPDADRSDASIVAAYAIARLRDGSLSFEVLTRQEIDARRARSMSRNDGPWVTDYARMARKTALRALFTGGLVPMSAEVVRAIEIDNDDVAEAYVEASPSDSARSSAASSLRSLAAGAVQQVEESAALDTEQVIDDGDPLSDLKADLARAGSAGEAVAIEKAWLKASEESLHGDIRALVAAKLKAL
jgi:recombination protein RecT